MALHSPLQEERTRQGSYVVGAHDDAREALPGARPEKVRASFGERYGRLRALKAVYDPQNMFRLNANIAP